MPKNKSLMDNLTGIFSLIPLILYTVVAILLTVIAIFSVYESASQIFKIFWGFINGTPSGIDLISVINTLLLTITIIVLFETVAVYFRTRHVEVRTLLIAGVTGVVRHVLVYNVGAADILQLFAAAAVLAVLIAGIVLIKPEQAG